MNEKEKAGAEHYEKMISTSVAKLVATLSIPTIISMLVTNIYNMVDTAFVGTLGTSASGAVGIVFGFMSIIQAIAFMCGQGGGSIMGRRLGQKNMKEATIYSSTAFFASFTFGALIGLLGFLFLDPLIIFLGSTPTIAPYAKQYLIFIMLGAPFISGSFTLNNLLRYEGKAKFGMIGLLSGALLNICGDAVFIFVLHLGVYGAGLSTFLSQIVGFSILLSMFLRKKTQTSIRLRSVVVKKAVLGNIMITGFPSLLRQCLNSIATIVLNSHAAVYGDAAVAAMSIVSRISFFVMSISLGIGQGFQPVSSFNFGAKRYDRVRDAYWFTVKLSELLLCIAAIGVFIYSAPLVALFRDDPVVIEYAIRPLRLQCITLLLVPISMVTEMGFQSTGQKLLASFSSSLRSGVIFIPVLLLLDHFRGMAGIQESQPAAFVIAFFVSVYLCRIFLNNLKKAEKNLAK